MTSEKSVKKCILETLEGTKELSKHDLRKAVIKTLSVDNDEKSLKKELKEHFKVALDALVEKRKILVTEQPDGESLVQINSSYKEDKKKRKNSATGMEEAQHDHNTCIAGEDDAHTSKKRKRSGSASSSSSSVVKQENALRAEEGKKVYPEYVPPTGDTTILLFYAYCNPQMTRAEQDNAISHCRKVLQDNGVTGRLRVGREGFNATLTGSHEGVRVFTAELRKFDPATFGETDFKYVDNLPDNQRLKELKVFPVTEIVTYGFNPSDAPLDMRGTHLKPHEFHEALANPNSILIDVRNFNETLIGRFSPPRLPGQDHDSKVLDPKMRRSTEFPIWVEENKHKFEGKQVLMCCTAGVRCERASAFMRVKGVQNVYQLEGGIHRYLDAFPEDGGYWAGKNYTFDKRFSHGAQKSEVVSHCVSCAEPWDRYQAQKKCCKCSMEVLVCKTCQRNKPNSAFKSLLCPLCAPKK